MGEAVGLGDGCQRSTCFGEYGLGRLRTGLRRVVVVRVIALQERPLCNEEVVRGRCFFEECRSRKRSNISQVCYCRPGYCLFTRPLCEMIIL